MLIDWVSCTVERRGRVGCAVRRVASATLEPRNAVLKAGHAVCYTAAVPYPSPAKSYKSIGALLLSAVASPMLGFWVSEAQHA